MIFFFLFVFGIYFLALILLMVGWRRAIKMKNNHGSNLRSISVVVPIRNEEKHLKTLIQNLSSQQYPVTHYEVLLVDDHSTDKSFSILSGEAMNKVNFKILQLQLQSGKKHALSKGIAEAKGDIIVTTDADCLHSPCWLSSINDGFEDTNTMMLIGAVTIYPAHKFFGQLQAIELTSLMATAIATAGLGSPILCNGANLAFRKPVFFEVDGYSGNETIPSGDDEFLLRKVQCARPGSVRFLNDKTAVVGTHPHETLNGFIQQRLRWAGKWKFNNLATKLVALFVLVVQSAWLVILFLILLGEISPGISAALVLGKLCLETLLLLPVANYLRVKWKWHLFLLLQFIYPFYVLYIGIRSLQGGYVWKGREVNHKM
jgi:cellulose synthase/poly-beta-1,6-N-acetylglucosamine synthase-like glycosyltransferase